MEGECWWWLRSPGSGNKYASYVDWDGNIRYGGTQIDNSAGCVRPAMWISLK